MGQVLVRAVSLLTRPSILAVVFGLAAGGTALIFTPLFGIPGYELGSAIALGVGLLGGAVGIAAAFDARRRPETSARSTVLAAFGAALLLNLAVLLPPLGGAMFFAWTSSHCDPFSAIAFYPLLTLPSAAIASAAGVASGFIARGWRWAGGAYSLMVLASAAVTVWPIFFGPQVYAYNHFAGYLPGPIYDELLKVRPGLLWHQLETLLIAALLVFGCWLFLDRQSLRLTRPHLRPLALLGCALSGFAIYLIEVSASPLGIRMSDPFLIAKLGGVRRSDHFLIVYPEGKPAEDVDRLVRDLEFRYHQLRQFFGEAPPGPIRVYLYRSSEEKQALVGAAQTQFAKPWRLEVHLNDLPFPHSALKHELAHLIAAPFGSGPLKITAHLGLWPVIGVIEGMATAADNPVLDLTLHQWAAAMRRKKLAPDLRSLFRVESFYANPGPRAYTLAGSFLRYLAETYGTDKLKALYRHGDFAKIYQRSLDALAREWESYVDALPLDSEAVDEAFARFHGRSLFARPCAREVVRLAELATSTLDHNPAEALRLYRRCASLQPDELSFQLGTANALRKLGRSVEASALLSGLATQVRLEPALEAEVAMALADLSWSIDDLTTAQSQLQKVIELKSSAAMDRAAHIKLAAIRSPALGRTLRSYFQSSSEDLKLFRLQAALERDPKDPYLNYLVGRRLTQAGAFGLAIPYLSQALIEEMPASILREAWRLKVQSEYLAGDCPGVETDLGMLPDLSAALKAEIAEWGDRCAFEQKAFQGLLVPEQAFR